MIFSHFLSDRLFAASLFPAVLHLLFHLFIFFLKISNLLLQTTNFAVSFAVLKLFQNLIHVEPIIFIRLILHSDLLCSLIISASLFASLFCNRISLASKSETVSLGPFFCGCSAGSSLGLTALLNIYFPCVCAS